MNQGRGLVLRSFKVISAAPASLLLSLFPEQLYRLCWTLRNSKEQRVDLDAGEMMQGVEDYEEEPGEITFTRRFRVISSPGQTRLDLS